MSGSVMHSRGGISGRWWAALLTLVLTVSGGGTVFADDAATVDVTFSTTSGGEFSVSMRAEDNGDAGFGVVLLDADQDVTVMKIFVLDYTDTLTSRGEGEVSISVESFTPETPVTPFPGSESATFQIPNRYLALTDVGEIEVVQPSVCTPGEITAHTDAEGMTFDLGASRRVADVQAGCGVGIASQPIELSLTVPAGIYPTTYVATVTIESTFD